MNLKAHAVLQNSVCLYDNNFPLSLHMPQQHCFVCLVQEKKRARKDFKFPLLGSKSGSPETPQDSSAEFGLRKRALSAHKFNVAETQNQLKDLSS